MGVIYHAHARFLDRKRGRVTVPAPVDPGTPDAPWWYDYIAAKAHGLAQAGLHRDHVSAGQQDAERALSDRRRLRRVRPVRHRLEEPGGSAETRFGNREQLQRSIAVARACGLDVYLDVVMHQQSGSNGGDGVYRYVGADGAPGAGRFPKHPGCFRGNPPRRPEDPVPGAVRRFRVRRRVRLPELRPAALHDRRHGGVRRLADPLARCPGLPRGRHQGHLGRLRQGVDDLARHGDALLRLRIFRRQSGRAELVGAGPDGRTLGGVRFHAALGAAGYLRPWRRHAAARPRRLYRARPVRRGDVRGQPGHRPVARRADHRLEAAGLRLHPDRGGLSAVYHKDYAQERGCYGLKPLDRQPGVDPRASGQRQRRRRASPTIG